MRRQKKPYQGYTPDRDQTFYWKFDEADGATAVDSSPRAAHLLCIVAGNAQASLFDPDSTSTGARSLRDSAGVNQRYFRSPTGLNGHLTTSTDWSFSGFYALSAGSGATQTLWEYATDGSPSGSAEALAMGVYYLGTQNRLMISFETAVNTFTRLVTTASVPATARIGISKKDTGATVSYSVFVNEKLVEVLTTLNNPSTTIGSSGKWYVGGSGRHSDASGASVTLGLSGFVDEFALWPLAFPDAKMVNLYGDCVRSYDDKTLTDANNQVVRIRVMIADANDVLVDYSQFSGKNWVVSATIDETVEEPSHKANVKLLRHFGKFADLSPLNTVSEFTNAIDFRRRVVIQRAVVPALYTMQGWEWETRFEGFIDSWKINGGEVELDCIDKLTPLIDQFILDSKQYDFYAVNKLAETHLQQIIDDNVPTLRGAVSQSTATVVGYKGGTPILYTEGGTAASVILENSGWLLRFNEVTTSPVAENLRALGDTIAFDLRYRYHQPWDSHRLEFYSPPRDKTLSILSVEELAGVVEVVTNRPHGMAENQAFTISGTANFDGSFTVGDVLGCYRLRAREGVTGTPAAELSTGSLGYSAPITLSGDDLISVDPVSSNIQDIRNHIVVKYARDGSGASFACIAEAAAVDGNMVTVTLPAEAEMGSLDPDQSGIEFTLSQAVGATEAPLNASYSGTIDSLTQRTITSNIPARPVGIDYSSTSIRFESEYYTFRQISVTDDASVSRYGVRQAGIYEAQITNLDTTAEALALATRVISDLSAPQADLTIRTRVLPLCLHDTVNLSDDAKGRWDGTLVCAVVGLKETYESGRCYADYTLRGSKPSAGRNSGRILIGPGKPGLYNGLKTTIAQDKLNLTMDLRHSMALPVRFDHLTDKRSLRHDRTEFHISTASGFIPNKDTLAGITRGNTFNITHDGDGNALSPGTVYFFALRHRDIDGNLTVSTNGPNAPASSASLPSAVVRFTNQTASAYAVKNSSTATVEYTVNTFTPLFMNQDDGSDALARSHDTFGNYSTASCLFTCPADGQYSVTFRSMLRQREVKASTNARFRVVRFASTGVIVATPVSFSFVNTGDSGSFIDVEASAVVHAFSGQFLQVQIASDSVFTQTNFTTGSSSHPFVAFSLLTQS